MSLLLPSASFAPIYQFTLFVNEQEYSIESKEHFIKQSFRNRFEIYSANGKLSLTVPVKKWSNHTPIDKVEISHDINWQQLHWRSITSSYSASPYFEFFEDQIKTALFSKEKNLLHYNLQLESTVKNLIGIQSAQNLSASYEKSNPDWRKIIHPKNKLEMQAVSFPNYMQVFAEKHGFIPNLSILDLLFNIGTESKSYLKQINHNQHHG